MPQANSSFAVISSVCGLALLAGRASAQSPQFFWSHPLDNPPSAVDVSPDGLHVVVGYGRSPCPGGESGSCPGIGHFLILTTEAGDVVSDTAPYHNGTANDVSWSSDGSLIGVAIGDAEIRRASDGGVAHQFFTSSGSAFDIAISPLLPRVFVGTTPFFGIGVHVYDAVSGAETNEFALVNFVAAMGISRVGHLLATANDASVVMVFNVTDPDHEQLLRALEDPNPWQEDDPYAGTSNIYGLAFTPDEQAVATMSSQRVTVWRVSDGTLLRTFESPDTYPNQVSGEFYSNMALSPDGRLLAVGGYEVIQSFMQYDTHGTLTVWDMASGEMLAHDREGLGMGVNDLVFTTDSQALVIGVRNEIPTECFVAQIAVPAAVPTCRADLNADGVVNPDDLSDFITCFFLDVQFSGVCLQADFNADQVVNPDDLSDFITAFFLAVQFGC